MEANMISPELLITLVQHHKHLYDWSHIDFRNAQRKMLAFSRIGSVFNVGPNECQKEWRKLRDKYVKEKTNGNSTWPLMKNMEFLDPHIKFKSGNNPGMFGNVEAVLGEGSPDDIFMNEDLPNAENKRETYSSEDLVRLLTEEKEPENSTNCTFAKNFENKPGCSWSPLKVVNSGKGDVEKAKAVAEDVKGNDVSQGTRRKADDSFGQYVARKLEETPPELRALKRRKIFFILEDEN